MSKKQITKAVAKKENSKKQEIWAGAQHLMGRTPEGTKEMRERRLILLTAKVLGVSPFGVNILGSVPYINKLGLMQKAKEYEPEVKFAYNFIQLAKDDAEKAIVSCMLKDHDDKPMTDWIMGECSPSSMKMGTLKGYQNHMAQTRARNRAILEAFGARIHEDMMEKIQQQYLNGKITEEQKDKVIMEMGPAGTASAEEIQEEKKGQGTLDSIVDSAELWKDIMELARKNGARAGSELSHIANVVGHTINFDNPTPRYLALIKAQFLNETVKKP